MLMMQAMTPRFLTLPVLTGLPVLCRVLTTSQHLTPGDFPLTRAITRAPLMSAPRGIGADVLARYPRRTGLQTWRVSHGDPWRVVAMEGNREQDSRHILLNPHFTEMVGRKTKSSAADDQR